MGNRSKVFGKGGHKRKTNGGPGLLGKRSRATRKIVDPECVSYNNWIDSLPKPARGKHANKTTLSDRKLVG